MLKEILERIRFFREQKNYSQEYMAYKLCIGQSSYAKIERNLVKLDLQRLIQISQLLEVDVYLLFSGNIPSKLNETDSEVYIKSLLDKIKMQDEEIKFLREVLKQSSVIVQEKQ